MNNITKEPLIKNNQHLEFDGDKLFLCFNPKHNNHYIQSEKEPGLRFFLVKPDFLSYIEKYTLLNQHITNPDSKINVADFLSKNIKEDINKSDFILIKEVKNSSGINAYMTENKKIHMSAIVLIQDYMTGINDIRYRLDDFLEHLSQRDDIALVANLGRWEKNSIALIPCPIKGDEPHLGKVIFDIDHHIEENESQPEEKETFGLIFYPKDEYKAAILEFDINNPQTRENYIKRQIYDVEKFIVQEILGGEEFIKKPIIEESPKRKFKH